MNQSTMTPSPDIGSDGKKFHVALNGVLPNVSPPDAKAKLATLFKATEAQIENLLATPGHIVKRSCAPDIAAKYKVAIERAGGACALIADEEPAVFLDIELPKAAPPVAAAQKAAPPPQQSPAPRPVTAPVEPPTAPATSQAPLGETVLFQGDASLIKSTLHVVQGRAVGTTERFTFEGGKSDKIVLEKADIQSAEEVKHLMSTKWVIKTRAGETYSFSAPNQAALRQTMLTLTGQAGLAKEAFKEPELSAVRNATAWWAAFGPTISGPIALLIGAILDWDWEQMSFLKLLQVFLVIKLPVIYMFFSLDHHKLQQQGFNTVKLGIARPTNFFIYLFSRAKAFGHRPYYAITFCATFGIEVLFLIFG